MDDTSRDGVRATDDDDVVGIDLFIVANWPILVLSI
jgi:hypothetical protein